MRTLHIISISAAVFVLDQISKWMILYLLKLPSIGAVEVIPGFVNFIMAWNKGINFGIFATSNIFAKIFLIVFPVVVSAALVWWNLKNPGRLLGLGSAFIIGGALGNALDRILYGAVVDFLNVTAFGIYNPFSFNIADVAIFLGAAIIIWDLQFDKKKLEPSEN